MSMRLHGCDQYGDMWWKMDQKRIPMYHPCANIILRPNSRKRTPVPIHLYCVYGVDLSR
jgi:hypothetical protein